MQRTNMKRPVRKRARGMTLLELVIASSMLAMVLTTIGVVMRTGRQAWEAHSADYTRIEAAHATVRHVVRRLRQAKAVSAITPSTDNSGTLSVQMQDGSIEVWDHDGGTNVINYGVTTASNLLSPNITGLRFTGYQANGTTTTTTASLIKAVRIEVSVLLPVDTGGARVVSSWAWLRSW
jgi:type II secretory pathway pseudopilin PulG